METLRVKHTEGAYDNSHQDDLETEELKAQWKAVISRFYEGEEQIHEPSDGTTTRR